jgi:pyruvate/2-oxoglutarate dehydrogenase complex dihydrolipoamide dehydrogenase (E3) component
VREDADASNLLTALFENRGITVLTKCEIQEVTKRGDKRVVHYKHKGAIHTTAVDRIVVATGKRPNLDLGLDAAGVAVTDGRLRLNRFMQTTVPHIFAAGDVSGTFMYTHTGEYQSEVAAFNAFHRHKTAIDYRIIPRAVYIDPEIASVGITEHDAAEQGIRLKVGVAPLAAIGRANTNDTLDGFVKILTFVDGRIAGACIVAPRASEMIHEIAVAMKFRATASDLVDIVHAYPTYSEAIKIACAVIE